MNKKIFVLILLFIEMIITISFIITWANYDYFWKMKINGYAFTWYWVKGLVGIILFIIELKLNGIKFKRDFICVLVIPFIYSIFNLIGVIMGIIHPWNYHYYIMDSLKGMLLTIGFPLWLIYLLQERHGIKKYLIGLSGILTPIMDFVIRFNVWIR
jgi:hypothetical protein